MILQYSRNIYKNPPSTEVFGDFPQILKGGGFLLDFRTDAKNFPPPTGGGSERGRRDRRPLAPLFWVRGPKGRPFWSDDQNSTHSSSLLDGPPPLLCPGQRVTPPWVISPKFWRVVLVKFWTRPKFWIFGEEFLLSGSC